MLKSWWSFPLLFIVASAGAMAQDKGIVLYPLPPSEDDERFIDRLKETPVSQIERGLPDQSFDSWCSRLVKPKRVEYEVRKSAAFPYKLWVIAYTQLSVPEGTRWIEVRFIVVDAPRRSKTTSNRGEPKPFALKFFDARESETIPTPIFPLPSNPILAGPRIKEPYGRFLKLSELEEEVQRSRVKPPRWFRNENPLASDPGLNLLPSAVSALAVEQDQDQRRLIDQLKTTPVSEIETGLPHESFDSWFANQVRPSHAEYEVDDCVERNGTPEERGKQFPACVVVTAIAGVRKVDLAFLVGTYVVPENGKDKARSKPKKVTLFSGSIGPSDPRMKTPTRVIRKLSDLERLLHP